MLMGFVEQSRMDLAQSRRRSRASLEFVEKVTRKVVTRNRQFLKNWKGPVKEIDQPAGESDGCESAASQRAAFWFS
jgi:hypothetical protein